MIDKTSNVFIRQDEIVRLGKEGRTTLQEVANAWDCKPATVANYLYLIHAEKGYAYLIDGKGYFRIFQEIT